jgi:hypothetical protein
MARLRQAALGLLEYRDVPGKMREATAGVTESTASAAALGHHPAGEHRDEAIHQVCAIARRYQRVVQTEPRQRLAPAKWRAAQASTRGRGVLRSLFAFATERGFRVGVPTNPTIVHIGTDQPEISPAKVARSGLQRLNP